MTHSIFLDNDDIKSFKNILIIVHLELHKAESAT